MPKRPCLGCGTPTTSSRCNPCERARDQARGTTTARGYGAAHQAERARWAPQVATGRINCWRCAMPIAPGDPWDLGHHDTDRNIYRGPEHEACNRATRSRTPTNPA